ncbi:nucleotidyltransferase domain-containing protein [candidate division KSB1 bacterium]|nr:nucleotidyltransferase domain-containing protein [candidate division KSB1 bacterium]
MKITQLQNLLKPLFYRHAEILLAYVFGSQINGRTGPQSDIDFALLLHRTIKFEKIQVVRHQIGQLLDFYNLDVISLNDATIELQYAVIATGKNIYKKDLATLVEFESKVLSLYGDYLPILRSQKQDVIGNLNYEKRIQRYRAAFGRTERTLGTIGAVKEKNAE